MNGFQVSPKISADWVFPQSSQSPGVMFGLSCWLQLFHSIPVVYAV